MFEAELSVVCGLEFVCTRRNTRRHKGYLWVCCLTTTTTTTTTTNTLTTSFLFMPVPLRGHTNPIDNMLRVFARDVLKGRRHLLAYVPNVPLEDRQNVQTRLLVNFPLDRNFQRRKAGSGRGRPVEEHQIGRRWTWLHRSCIRS